MIKNRVKEFKMMSPKDVAFNDKNWRKHPTAQTKAMQALLEEIGIAGAMLAYHSERQGGKLTLIDGHLRKEIAPGEDWPILITDLTDSEADLLLASYDPIGAMAEADKERLNDLLHDINSDNAEIQKLLSTIAEKEYLNIPEFKEYDESIENEVEYLECPSCGHRWPK